MPISAAARMTRMAISDRLATNKDWMRDIGISHQGLGNKPWIVAPQHLKLGASAAEDFLS
jgi:hypothetical protein